MSKYHRFKLRQKDINIDLIRYFKGVLFDSNHATENLLYVSDFDLEVKAIDRAVDCLRMYLKTHFNETLEDNER